MRQHMTLLIGPSSLTHPKCVWCYGRWLLLGIVCLRRKLLMLAEMKTSYRRVATSLLVKSLNLNTQKFVGNLKHVMVWPFHITLFAIGIRRSVSLIVGHIFGNSFFPLRQRRCLLTGLFFSQIRHTLSASGLSGKRLRFFVVGSQASIGSTHSLVIGLRSSLDDHLA